MALLLPCCLHSPPAMTTQAPKEKAPPPPPPPLPPVAGDQRRKSCDVRRGNVCTVHRVSPTHRTYLRGRRLGCCGCLHGDRLEKGCSGRAQREKRDAFFRFRKIPAKVNAKREKKARDPGSFQQQVFLFGAVLLYCANGCNDSQRFVG